MSTKKDSQIETTINKEWEKLEKENKDKSLNPTVGSHLSASAASLAGKLSKEKDDRQEERFYWIFSTIMLIDVIIFQSLGKVAAIFISMLELVFLIGIAKFLGVDAVVKLLENMFNN